MGIFEGMVFGIIVCGIICCNLLMSVVIMESDTIIFIDFLCKLRIKDSFVRNLY